MATIERTYNVPLRKEFRKAPIYRRAKKAVAALTQFLERHMKSDDVRLGRHVNMKIWENGIRNPPHHVKVTCVKTDDGVVKVELFGFRYEELTKDEREKLLEAKKPKEKKAEAPKADAKKDDDIKDLEKALDAEASPAPKEDKKPKAEVKKEPAPKAEKKPKAAAAEKPKKKAVEDKKPKAEE